MQSSAQWVPISLWNITSVLAAGSAPTRTRRVRWSASPALRDPPRLTCTPAASPNAKVRSISCSWSSCVSESYSDAMLFQDNASLALTPQMDWRSASRARWVTTSLLTQPGIVSSVPKRPQRSPEEQWTRLSAEVTRFIPPLKPYQHAYPRLIILNH